MPGRNPRRHLQNPLVFGLLLSPIIASTDMTFSSVSVIANALRLRRLALRTPGELCPELDIAGRSR